MFACLFYSSLLLKSQIPISFCPLLVTLQWCKQSPSSQHPFLKFRIIIGESLKEAIQSFLVPRISRVLYLPIIISQSFTHSLKTLLPTVVLVEIKYKLLLGVPFEKQVFGYFGVVFHFWVSVLRKFTPKWKNNILQCDINQHY